MNKSTAFQEEWPTLAYSGLAMIAIVVLLVTHTVPANDPLILTVFVPLLYFGTNGLIRLNNSTSSQQLTTEQVQQLIAALAQLQPPVQHGGPPAPASSTSVTDGAESSAHNSVT